MRQAPKKERYVIYVSPEIGAALREEKARRRGATFSAIAERYFRKGMKLPRVAKSA